MVNFYEKKQQKSNTDTKKTPHRRANILFFDPKDTKTDYVTYLPPPNQPPKNN